MSIKSEATLVYISRSPSFGLVLILAGIAAFTSSIIVLAYFLRSWTKSEREEN